MPLDLLANALVLTRRTRDATNNRASKKGPSLGDGWSIEAENGDASGSSSVVRFVGATA
jgi:hypothetical protein